MKGLVVLLAALAALLGASSASAYRHCGTFDHGEDTFSVVVEKGALPCWEARHVLHAFLSGQGIEHGGATSPSYEKTWSLHRGWKCGHGAGGGACVRGGSTYLTARDWVIAQTTD